jgi:hypothetical protein
MGFSSQSTPRCHVNVIYLSFICQVGRRPAPDLPIRGATVAPDTALTAFAVVFD